MGAAIYVSLQREIPGFDSSSVDGKALSKEVELLDALARKLKVKPIMELYSINPGELTDLLEGISPPGEELEAPRNVKERWFSASEGLKTVRALLKNVKAAKVKNPERVKEDLTHVEEVLAAAHKNKIRFHFSMDI